MSDYCRNTAVVILHCDIVVRREQQTTARSSCVLWLIVVSVGGFRVQRPLCLIHRWWGNFLTLNSRSSWCNYMQLFQFIHFIASDINSGAAGESVDLFNFFAAFPYFLFYWIWVAPRIDLILLKWWVIYIWFIWKEIVARNALAINII